MRLTLKVGHVCPDVRVECVHNHLPVGGAGDLDSTVDETRCGRCSFPCIVLTDVLGLWEEVEEVALVELGLANLAALEQGLAGAIERAVQESKEDGCVFGQDLAGLVVEGSEDVDFAENVVCVLCAWCHDYVVCLDIFRCIKLIWVKVTLGV